MALRFGSCTALSLLVLLLTGAPSFGNEPSIGDLSEMSLEELMSIEVTSVSKRSEPLSKAAAAVYVITEEDIRRSGATSIPEALRLAPGVQVARISSSRWAISIRGFTSQYSNKLLVLIDGLSVYTPLYSGVYWNTQDLLLEDVERVEVIRGPGAALWGANAVNGVINIITKHSEMSDGVLLSAGGWNEERGFGSARLGGRVGEGTTYRGYVKYADRDGVVDGSGADVGDDWSFLGGGFRVDHEGEGGKSLLLKGTFYDGVADYSYYLPRLTRPYMEIVDSEDTFTGGNILGRWSHQYPGGSSMNLQAYFDYSDRSEQALHEIRQTADIEWQLHRSFGRRHDLVCGIGYRITSDETRESFSLSLTPESRTDHLFSAFIHDDIEILPNRLSLILGTKLERNEYTGLEYQPSGRLLWLPSPEHTVWAALSRAVRTPSRVESDVRVNYATIPDVGGMPGLLGWNGNEDLVAEELLASEIGYRATPTRFFSLDIAGFYNSYDNLLTHEPTIPYLDMSSQSPHMVMGTRLENNLTANTFGFEVVSGCRLTDWWQLHSGYTQLKMEFDLDPASVDTTRAERISAHPEHQFHLRSNCDLPRNIQLDLAAYYVGELVNNGVSAYTRLDTRIGWLLIPGMDLSLVITNLLDERHPEFVPNYGVEPTEIERSFYGKVTYRF